MSNMNEHMHAISSALQ